MKPSVRATNPRLRLKLLAMAKVDQEMRVAARKQGKPWNDTIDAKNTKQLKQIIAKFGWPTIPMVGVEASIDAWLIAQHADDDIAFQKECLAILKALPPGSVSLHNIAYLEDRILVAEHKPQIYGTQFQGNGDDLRPQPIADEASVDERRRAMDLGTLAEYKKTMLEMAAKANLSQQ